MRGGLARTRPRTPLWRTPDCPAPHPAAAAARDAIGVAGRSLGARGIVRADGAHPGHIGYLGHAPVLVTGP